MNIKYKTTSISIFSIALLHASAIADVAMPPRSALNACIQFEEKSDKILKIGKEAIQELSLVDRRGSGIENIVIISELDEEKNIDLSWRRTIALKNLAHEVWPKAPLWFMVQKFEPRGKTSCGTEKIYFSLRFVAENETKLPKPDECYGMKSCWLICKEDKCKFNGHALVPNE